MLITGPIATLRSLLDRFGASRIDCEECECSGVWCDDCPRVEEQLSTDDDHARKDDHV